MSILHDRQFRSSVDSPFMYLIKPFDKKIATLYYGEFLMKIQAEQMQNDTFERRKNKGPGDILEPVWDMVKDFYLKDKKRKQDMYNYIFLENLVY